MAYDLDSRLFVENGPTVAAERAQQARSNSTARAWRILNESRRLELVQAALRAPANDDLPDGFPVAL